MAWIGMLQPTVITMHFFSLLAIHLGMSGPPRQTDPCQARILATILRQPIAIRSSLSLRGVLYPPPSSCGLSAPSIPIPFSPLPSATAPKLFLPRCLQSPAALLPPASTPPQHMPFELPLYVRRHLSAASSFIRRSSPAKALFRLGRLPLLFQFVNEAIVGRR